MCAECVPQLRPPTTCQQKKSAWVRLAPHPFDRFFGLVRSVGDARAYDLANVGPGFSPLRQVHVAFGVRHEMEAVLVPSVAFSGTKASIT